MFPRHQSAASRLTQAALIADTSTGSVITTNTASLLRGVNGLRGRRMDSDSRCSDQINVEPMDLGLYVVQGLGRTQMEK